MIKRSVKSLLCGAMVLGAFIKDGEAVCPSSPARVDPPLCVPDSITYPFNEGILYPPISREAVRSYGVLRHIYTRGHIIPSDHTYIYFDDMKNPDPSTRFPVFAMKSGRIKEISRKGENDYTIRIEHSCEVQSYYYHVSELAGPIKSYLDSNFSGWDACSDNWRLSPNDLNISVTSRPDRVAGGPAGISGDEIAYVKYPKISFDVGLIDSRFTSGAYSFYQHNEGFEADSHNFINYLFTNDRNLWSSNPPNWMEREKSEELGWDIPTGIRGTWFAEEYLEGIFPKEYRASEYAALTIIPSSDDPPDGKKWNEGFNIVTWGTKDLDGGDREASHLAKLDPRNWESCHTTSEKEGSYNSECEKNMKRMNSKESEMTFGFMYERASTSGNFFIDPYLLSNIGSIKSLKDNLFCFNLKADRETQYDYLLVHMDSRSKNRDDEKIKVRYFPHPKKWGPGHDGHPTLVEENSPYGTDRPCDVFAQRPGGLNSFINDGGSWFTYSRSRRPIHHRFTSTPVALKDVSQIEGAPYGNPERGKLLPNGTTSIRLNGCTDQGCNPVNVTSVISSRIGWIMRSQSGSRIMYEVSTHTKRSREIPYSLSVNYKGLINLDPELLSQLSGKVWVNLRSGVTSDSIPGDGSWGLFLGQTINGKFQDYISLNSGQVIGAAKEWLDIQTTDNLRRDGTFIDASRIKFPRPADTMAAQQKDLPLSHALRQVKFHVYNDESPALQGQCFVNYIPSSEEALWISKLRDPQKCRYQGQDVHEKLNGLHFSEEGLKSKEVTSDSQVAGIVFNYLSMDPKENRLYIAFGLGETAKNIANKKWAVLDPKNWPECLNENHVECARMGRRPKNFNSDSTSKGFVVSLQPYTLTSQNVAINPDPYDLMKDIYACYDLRWQNSAGDVRYDVLFAKSTGNQIQVTYIPLGMEGSQCETEINAHMTSGGFSPKYYKVFSR